MAYELSEKLFGNTNPLGQEISLVLNGEETLFKVGGMMQKLNDMEMFNFDLLVNVETISDSQHALPLKETWDSESWTFIQLQKGANPDQLHSGLEEIKRRQNEINPESPYLKLDLVAFTDLVKEAEGIENGVVGFLAIGPQSFLGQLACLFWFLLYSITLIFPF